VVSRQTGNKISQFSTKQIWTCNADEKMYILFMHFKHKENFLSFVGKVMKILKFSRQGVPKRRHIKFRRRGITQKKSHNIQNKAKVWNQ